MAVAITLAGAFRLFAVAVAITLAGTFTLFAVAVAITLAGTFTLSLRGAFAASGTRPVRTRSRHLKDHAAPRQGMVTVVDALSLAFILLVHTAITAMMTRFFRVRLSTRWGGFLYAVLLCPVVLVGTTLLFSGIFGLGPDLGSAAAVVGLVIALPLATGITFDYFWMPAPDDVDLPEKWEDDRPNRYERRPGRDER
jgi:ABC-type polysaccharide/polyol phosphate export permease